jgi:hypothetical protein
MGENYKILQNIILSCKKTTFITLFVNVISLWESVANNIQLEPNVAHAKHVDLHSGPMMNCYG